MNVLRLSYEYLPDSGGIMVYVIDDDGGYNFILPRTMSVLAIENHIAELRAWLE